MSLPVAKWSNSMVEFFASVSKDYTTRPQEFDSEISFCVEYYDQYAGNDCDAEQDVTLEELEELYKVIGKFIKEAKAHKEKHGY